MSRDFDLYHLADLPLLSAALALAIHDYFFEQIPLAKTGAQSLTFALRFPKLHSVLAMGGLHCEVQGGEGMRRPSG